MNFWMPNCTIRLEFLDAELFFKVRHEFFMPITDFENNERFPDSKQTSELELHETIEINAQVVKFSSLLATLIILTVSGKESNQNLYNVQTKM